MRNRRYPKKKVWPKKNCFKIIANLLQLTLLLYEIWQQKFAVNVEGHFWCYSICCHVTNGAFEIGSWRPMQRLADRPCQSVSATRNKRPLWHRLSSRLYSLTFGGSLVWLFASGIINKLFPFQRLQSRTDGWLVTSNVLPIVIPVNWHTFTVSDIKTTKFIDFRDVILNLYT